MLKEGMIIGERYEIISKIGSGGMADVYKAKDHKLNRLVAVKVMKAEFSADRAFIAKFEKEAQAAAGLNHPNVVNVYDVGENQGIYYIVMELVQGITLKDYITRKGKLTVREATSIAIQVSLALEAAHKSGIVHRDVKPQNIIISTDGKVKLSDFGIARAASSNTISSNVMGSVHYSSPEQVRGGYSDAKSDIYSLGITMYEMLTGRVPFDGDTTVAIAIKHLQEEIESPRKYVPDIPFSLEQIILKCTQKGVERRYENISLLIEDLKHSLLDPDGTFVNVAPLSSHAQTMMLSASELEAIREGRSGYAVLPKKESAAPKYEEELEDEFEDDEFDDEDGDISSKLEKAMTIGGFVIGALIIGILIFVIAKATGFFQGGGLSDGFQVESQEEEPEDTEEGLVAVPKIVGMTEAYAVELLEELGFKGNKVGEEQSSEYQVGQIMFQDVAEGTEVAPGTLISYKVCIGAEGKVVPSVVGLSQAEAEAQIIALGLETQIESGYSDTVEAGKVIEVRPNVGVTVVEGEKVTLVISKGAENKQIKMFSVVGLTEEVAKQALIDNGFQVVVETTNETSIVGEGEVAEQSIPKDTMVDYGSSITIKVYHAPEPTATPTPTQVPTQTPTDSTATTTGTWKCNVRLDQPQSFTGGPVLLTLVQNVNGQNVETILVDGTTVSFPYDLSVAGAPGVTTGTVYLEELVDGEYIERGHYSNVPFSQS